ncbi:hypothetical protein BHE74_00046151 [Ensete ventricosum]|nr:hypothetical protein BHE74_00046151 [Ensete ventricosum]
MGGSEADTKGPRTSVALGKVLLRSIRRQQALAPVQQSIRNGLGFRHTRPFLHMASSVHQWYQALRLIHTYGERRYSFKSVPAITDGDIKSSEGKERNSIQRLKGSLGSLNIIAGKNSNEPNKTSAAADRVLSQSDSGSDDSSEGSDAKSEDDLEQKPSGKQELLNGRHYKICT